MSYREENGQVILTMSPNDWRYLLLVLGYAMGYFEVAENRQILLSFLNRLNEGNPNYTPYQVK